MITAGNALAAIWAETFHPAGKPPEFPLWSNEHHPWSVDMVTYYLERYSRPGDLVLDPFAVQAALLQSAQANRRRLLLSHFSPANMLGLLTAAAPPDQAVLDAAFSRIADAPRRGRTLAYYLQALYETICPECAQTCHARYYLWDRTAGEPVAKEYHCSFCHSSGRAAADMADVDLAAGLEIRGAAYWGLLSRLVAPGDPLLAQVRGLLDLYTPRALLAISELITAVEQRLVEPDERRAGRALILHVLERCISLQEWPTSGILPPSPQPLQPNLRLKTPTHFVEYSVWQAFEAAYRVLRAREPRSLAIAMDFPPEHGQVATDQAVLLSLALPELARRLEPESVTLVLSEPPMLAPAVHTLHYLWAGWLYGRQVAHRLQSVLKATSQDWDWYSRVMTTALRTLRLLLKPNGHLVFAFSDRTARRPLALLTAASQAGFRLVAQATQAPLTVEDGLPAWRLVMTPDRPASHPAISTPAHAEVLRQTAQAAVQNVLTTRAEPVPLSLLHTAFAVSWAESGLLSYAGQDHELARRPVSFLVQQARLTLAPELPMPGLRFYPAQGEKEVAQWAPLQPYTTPPLADRAEVLIARLLAERTWNRQEIELEVYRQLPGWETPDAGLIQACLTSYGQENGEQWRLRAEDEPTRRARERANVLLQLYHMGHRLGYQVWIASREAAAAQGLVPIGSGGPPEDQLWWPAGLVWHRDGRPAHAFALALQATLQAWLAPPAKALGGCPRYVVLPGGRASLLAFKLRRCPIWRTWLATTGWEFIKFRHVRKLAEQPDLNLAGFRARIGLDPVVTRPDEQLSLFSEPVVSNADDSWQAEDRGQPLPLE